MRPVDTRLLSRAGGSTLLNRRNDRKRLWFNSSDCNSSGLVVDEFDNTGVKDGAATSSAGKRE